MTERGRLTWPRSFGSEKEVLKHQKRLLRRLRQGGNNRFISTRPRPGRPFFWLPLNFVSSCLSRSHGT